MSSFPPPATPIEPTFAGYDLWAAQYDAFNNPMVALVERAMELQPPMVSGQRVLELGCGTARNAAFLLRQGAAHYTGVDGSAGMLAQGRERSAGMPVALLQGDITAELPLPAGGFDYVLFSLVIEHLEDPTAALREAVRLLSPGGTLRILELHGERQRAGSSAHFNVEGRRVQLASYPHDLAELRAILQALGMEVVRSADRAADSVTLTRCPLMAKYGTGPMLLDVEGRRPGQGAGGAGSSGRRLP